jgi:hypothetical protein
MFGNTGSCATLEDWFDPQRTRDDYFSTGFKPIRPWTFARKIVRPLSHFSRHSELNSNKWAYLQRMILKGNSRKGLPYTEGDNCRIPGRMRHPEPIWHLCAK